MKRELFEDLYKVLADIALCRRFICVRLYFALYLWWFSFL